MTLLSNKKTKVDDSTSISHTTRLPISSSSTQNHSLLFPSTSQHPLPSLSLLPESDLLSTQKIRKRIEKDSEQSIASPTQFPEAFFLNRKLQLYYGKYPSPLELLRIPFGRPSTNHAFTSESTLDHVLIYVFKSTYLSDPDLTALRTSHPLYNHLFKTIIRMQHIDFRPISTINKNYATQTHIPPSRSIHFTSALLHCNFDVPSIIRYCQNNYTNQHINPDAVRKKLQKIASQCIIDYVYRSLVTGAPSKIYGHTTSKFFWKYLRYGNHVSISARPELVEKTLNKEERNNYSLPFPSWTARFIPHLHVSPSGIIFKPGKKDRIIFDASYHVDALSFSPNDWTHAADEPPIYYGDALVRHLQRIWNLRITYPNAIIYLWDDDVAGAFRLIKYNPQISTAFASIINLRLWVPVGQVFGGNTSAQNFEGIAMARECLSEHLSTKKFSYLIEKHKNILDLIQYEHPPTSIRITPACKCTQHTGILDINNQPTNTQHHMFVDDNHIASLLPDMRLAQAASIKGLFQILGFPAPELRRTALSEDKYYREKCSYKKIQLGYLLNTCSMTVSFAPDRFEKILSSLSNFHSKRKIFTLREAATLAGHIEFFASMTPWLRFVTIALKHSILKALQANTKTTLSKSTTKNFISDSKLLSIDFDSLRKKHFAISQLLRQTWHSRTKFRVSPSLRKEIKLLQYLFKNRTKFHFSSPIAHIIPKDFDYSAKGDACLDGAGGFSSSLKFWWYVQWPDHIKMKTLKHFVKIYKTISGDFVSINLLEYVTIIISYAACVTKLRQIRHHLQHPNPTILIESDNTTAVSWTRKAASSTQAGKQLAFLLTSIMIQHQHVGLSSTHISGIDNTVADEISRTPSLSSPASLFSSITYLKQKFPQLTGSQQFLPSQSLLSTIWDALLLKQVHPLQILDNLGHFRPDTPCG